jgi:hypothetical protein
MTVGELIEHLKQFDQNLVVASEHYGNLIGYDDDDFELCDYRSEPIFLKINIPGIGELSEHDLQD